jgi:hypothetical protein
MPVPSPPSGCSLTPGWVGRSLVVLLGLNVGLAWLAIQGQFVLGQAVWLAAAGQVFEGVEPGRIAGQLGRLRLAQAGLAVGTAILFLAWVHRANWTLGRLGGPPVLPARDGVRALLVPGVNLVRIPSVVATLWRSSTVTGPARSIATWVAWWWGLCLATMILDLATVPWGRSTLLSLGLGGAPPVLVLRECARIAAAVLTIVIVTRIGGLQRDRCAATSRIHVDA